MKKSICCEVRRNESQCWVLNSGSERCVFRDGSQNVGPCFRSQQSGPTYRTLWPKVQRSCSASDGRIHHRAFRLARRSSNDSVQSKRWFFQRQPLKNNQLSQPGGSCSLSLECEFDVPPRCGQNIPTDGRSWPEIPTLTLWISSRGPVWPRWSARLDSLPVGLRMKLAAQPQLRNSLFQY